ncbi:extensin-like [Vigna umbellata]|uniref:extensin-like n=1 Tax=Vigna umbellata TaxID=87088 RepID=UPI001F5F52B3|nr:extensin-like [Vigna umbellata]
MRRWLVSEAEAINLFTRIFVSFKTGAVKGNCLHVSICTEKLVHRSVQILRDKQELADTQKELAKLQLAQKESSSSTHSQSNEERSSPTTDPKKTDNASDANNQQLALALPHQISPQQQPAAPPAQAQAPASNVTQAPQQPPYYMPPTPLQNTPVPQNQYLPSDQQYRTPQLVAPQPTPSQVTPTPPVQQFSHYQQQQPQPQQQQQQLQQQQQWSQQVPSPQPPSMQSQTRPPSPAMYPPYQPNQATNPSPAETLPNSMPMQVPYSGVPPPGSSRADTIPYGYGGAGRTVQQQPPPQQMKGSFPAPPSEMYGPTGSLPALPPPGSAYMMYEGEGGRTHHPPQPHFTQPGYPPTSGSLQNPPSHNLMVRNPNQSQFVRNHPYNELIEKLVSMGFRGDHVVSVIQRMEESGQAIDFNSVLDRLNVHSSVGPQRGWSG